MNDFLNYSKSIPWDEYLITEKDVYDEMGYRNEDPPQKDFRDIIQNLIGEIKNCSETPSMLFTAVNGILQNDTLSLNETDFNIGHIIAAQLRKSATYIVFAATAGHSFSDWQDRLAKEGDIAKIYITNILGSIIAEKTADKMELALEAVLPEGIHHTNRFSPGYCGWQVSEQKKLFSLFPVKEPCGITLTDSCLMLPIKSVSGIIGLGKNVHKLEYSCGLCTAEFCYKRKKK
jgi:hypothetical protein